MTLPANSPEFLNSASSSKACSNCGAFMSVKTDISKVNANITVVSERGRILIQGVELVLFLSLTTTLRAVFVCMHCYYYQENCGVLDVL